MVSATCRNIKGIAEARVRYHIIRWNLEILTYFARFCAATNSDKLSELDLKTADRLMYTTQTAWERYRDISRTLQERDPSSTNHIHEKSAVYR